MRAAALSPVNAPADVGGAVPSPFGRYAILGRIAAGGMATVYVGRQCGAAGFERVVAIKACHEELRRDEAFVTMFLEEARLGARIRHPNVVATLDVHDGNPLYLVMEYVDGGSLAILARRAAKRGERLPLDVALRIVMDALAGLHATHECRGADGRPLGLVHRDVSPQNILVGIDGAARITDFGIVTAPSRVGVAAHGAVAGKLAYMAPEQLGGTPITQLADVFAMGAVLWELLTGQMLYPSRGNLVSAALARRSPVARPSEIEPSVPRALDAIVLRALEHDPARRFSSALELLEALERVPCAPATARTVGQWVRREMTGLLPELDSATYAIHSDASALASGTITVDGRDERTTEEMPTRLVAPDPVLLADTRAAPALEAAPDALRMRRIIVAIVLVLVGSAVGLLLSSTSSPSPAAPAAPSSSAPLPAH